MDDSSCWSPWLRSRSRDPGSRRGNGPTAVSSRRSTAAGQDESSPDLFGFSADGVRLWRQDCGEALWEARFLPLPGDSALGFVPAYEARGTPRPLPVPGAVDTPRQSHDGSSRWNVIGEGTRVVEWRSDGDALKITCRDILRPEPVWSTMLPDSQAECRCRESGGVVGTRTAWLAWQCDFKPFPVIAVDLDSGVEIARRTFGGYAARFFAEPGGRRLLLWMQDYDHRGRMFLLDGTTLATLDTLVVPDGWYPRNFDGGGNRWSADGLTLANVRDCGLPKGTAGADMKLEPLALVVTWGEPVSIHLLPVAACLDAKGEVKAWYEWFSDGSWRHIVVETWTPFKNPEDERQWYERRSRIRR